MKQNIFTSQVCTWEIKFAFIIFGKNKFWFIPVRIVVSQGKMFTLCLKFVPGLNILLSGIKSSSSSWCLGLFGFFPRIYWEVSLKGRM
jgi:hypothetical protein